MKEISCQLLVIGSGPGGYVCAIRAGQLGVQTVVVEADMPGGTCLNVGCIPSKALIHVADEFARVKGYADCLEDSGGGDGAASGIGISATAPAIDLARTMAWKNGIVARLNRGVTGLLKKAGVTQISGRARFVDGKTIIVEPMPSGEGEPLKIHAQNTVIATGSAPVALPTLPFGEQVLSSTQALALTQVPDRLVVVGGGYIGLELGGAFAKLGSQVTVVEAQQQVLSQYDKSLVAPVLKQWQSLGAAVVTGAVAQSFANQTLVIKTAPGAEQEIPADLVLVAVGRRPVTEGWGREELVLDMQGPYIKINDQCKTNMRGIYAIGDVTGEPMLAHRAMAQGEMVAELVAGKKRRWDKQAIPAICFTDPQIVSVGLTPEQAREAGEQIVTGEFPFKASGRAMATEREDGFIRVVARADNHLVLGMQAVGVDISELSSGMSLALEMGARLEDIAATIHAHPTRSEGVAEAAMKALGHALHI